MSNKENDILREGTQECRDENCPQHKGIMANYSNKCTCQYTHTRGDHADDPADREPCYCNLPKSSENEIWEDGYSFGIYKAREIIDELRKALLQETTIGEHTIKVFDEIAKKIWLNKK